MFIAQVVQFTENDTMHTLIILWFCSDLPAKLASCIEHGHLDLSGIYACRLHAGLSNLGKDPKAW
jgi:hypothetical protein